jgi:hypothetical protein
MSTRHAARHVAFFPSSVAGWWSIGLFLGTAVVRQAMSSGTFNSRTVALTALVAAGASAVLAVWAFLRRHDHAVVLALPLIFALFGALFVLGEVLIGHD